jgi:hypothetical protein
MPTNPCGEEQEIIETSHEELMKQNRNTGKILICSIYPETKSTCGHFAL